jgi:23S rRNA (pseudouridine1915-N3)-methyltransferase
VAKLFVVALAARLPRWASEARDAYLGRMPRGFEVRCLELKAGPLKRVRMRLPQGTRLIALDERGRDFTSAQFAAALQGWRTEGDPVAFVVGGPDGLDLEFRRAASLLLKLSSFTLPHALAQVLLCEQLYRAASILTGHPYHRE